jgi:hypothetical protein
MVAYSTVHGTLPSGVHQGVIYYTHSHDPAPFAHFFGIFLSWNTGAGFLFIKVRFLTQPRICIGRYRGSDSSVDMDKLCFEAEERTAFGFGV